MELQEEKIRMGRLHQRGFVRIRKSRNSWKKIREFVVLGYIGNVFYRRVFEEGKGIALKEKRVYGKFCWLCNGPYNTTYVGHFHFLYVINAVDSEGSLVNKAVKTGVGGDQQNLCKQIVVTCHLTSTFLQFMNTKKRSIGEKLNIELWFIVS